MGSCPHPEAESEALFPARDYITGDEFSLRLCRRCGLGRTIPIPNGAAMSKYYPAHYYGSADQSRFPPVIEKLQNLLYARRVEVVERLAGRKGSVLDVGCGRGYLLQEFWKAGWEVQGTEFTDSAAEYARRLFGIPVHSGDLLTFHLPSNHFDAIVLWHVLEHVVEPAVVLREVFRLLKPGGVFLVAVPNWGSWESRWARDKWFHLDVPRHLIHFTQPVLMKSLAESGFSIERQSCFSLEYDLFSFMQSALNRTGVRPNYLYNLLRGKEAKVIGSGSSFGSLIATAVLAVPLGLLGLPATILAGMAGSGGTLTVHARKGGAVADAKRFGVL